MYVLQNANALLYADETPDQRNTFAVRQLPSKVCAFYSQLGSNDPFSPPKVEASLRPCDSAILFFT